MTEDVSRQAKEDGAVVALSVILPAYNEAGLIDSRLERLIHHLSSRDDAWEILVIDDGSTDDTAGRVAARASREPRLRLHSLQPNQGKGAAIARGMAEARGAILATTDADLSYALTDLDEVVAAISRGADIATGTRHHPESRINLPFGLFPYLVRRWLAGMAFRLLVRWLFRLDVSDTQCGLKAFSRGSASAVLPRLATRRFLADIEVFLVARGLGLRIEEVPVHLRYLSGTTSVRMLGGLPATLRDLARIKAAEMRGRYE
jgi:glycosyltransferase involved in cell wall biosynthesis